MGRGSVSVGRGPCVGTAVPGVTMPLVPRHPCRHLAPGDLAKAIPGVPGWPPCPAPSPAGSIPSLWHRVGPGTVTPHGGVTVTLRAQPDPRPSPLWQNPHGS